MVVNGEPGTIRVEFFGPFREFGTELELSLEGELGYQEIIDRLAGELGEAFRERAMKRNTTFILNKNVIRRKGLSEIRMKPGDQIAFALVLGGG
jgi:molybdopterin converting factor small subunit